MWIKIKLWILKLLGINMTPILLYDNALDNAAITTNAPLTGYSPDYLKDKKTFTYWKGGSATSNILIIDLGSSKYISAVAFGAHNFKDVKAKIKIEKSSNGTTWTAVGNQFNVESSNAIVRVLSSNESASALELLQGGSIGLLQGGDLLPLQGSIYSARYWKITFTTIAAPRFAVLYMGEYIKFEFPPDSSYVPNQKSIVANVSDSNEGHMLGAEVKYFPKETNPTFSNFTRTWYATKLDAFWENHGKYLLPFFWAWDIDNRPNDIFYCVLKQSMVMQEPLRINPYVEQLQLNFKILA